MASKAPDDQICELHIPAESKSESIVQSKHRINDEYNCTGDFDEVPNHTRNTGVFEEEVPHQSNVNEADEVPFHSHEFDEVPHQRNISPSDTVSNHADVYDEVPHQSEVDQADKIPNHPADEAHGHHKTNLINEESDSGYQMVGEDSLLLFYKDELYDKLDEVDSLRPDPGSSPDALLTANDSQTDFPSIGLRKNNCVNYKVKSLSRMKFKEGGVVGTHTTFFPRKLSDKKAPVDEINTEVNSDYYYDMNTFPRGVLTIFNVKDFQESSGMSDFPRNGTERDADGLCCLFLDLGFIVERYDNPTKNVMKSALKVAASDEKSSCCACAILTHGEEGIVYATDDSLQIKDIAETFRKRNLAGKPKFFLFQACRGTDYMDAIDAVDGPPDQASKDVALPCEADFLYAYSTVPGYYSWRNSRQGSWFMQAICSVFRENAHSMDLYRMLTRVNDYVSSRKSRTEDIATDDKRQVASIVSQMRKELFFFPPYGPLPII